MAAANASSTADREIVVSRVFSAPRELVFQVWTDPQHLAQWWGPNGFSTTTHEMDFRSGGVWRYIMHGPDGRDYKNRVVFTKIVEPERIVFVHDDSEEGVEPSNHNTTVTFEDLKNGKTKLTLHMVFSSAAEKDRIAQEYGAVEGGMQTIARLAEYVASQNGGKVAALTIALPSEKEVILRRVFSAPRRLVFEAFSKPELISQWWGPRDYQLVSCEIDFRPGGTWRFVQHTPNGQEHPFTGEYTEIVAPERIVQTFIYDVEGIRDYPATETIVLTEQDGKTILTNRVLHMTQQARDGHLFSGMEWGAAQSMDRLEELLVALPIYSVRT